MRASEPQQCFAAFGHDSGQIGLLKRVRRQWRVPRGSNDERLVSPSKGASAQHARAQCTSHGFLLCCLYARTYRRTQPFHTHFLLNDGTPASETCIRGSTAGHEHSALIRAKACATDYQQTLDATRKARLIFTGNSSFIPVSS